MQPTACPQTKPHRSSAHADRHKISRNRLTENPQNDAASISGSASIASRSDALSACNCPECCDCADCQTQCLQNTLPASRANIFNQRGAHVQLSNEQSANVNANLPFAFTLPPPPPLPTESPRKVKKPVRKKKNESGAMSESMTDSRREHHRDASANNRHSSRRNRAARDDDRAHDGQGRNDQNCSKRLATQNIQLSEAAQQNLSDSSHSTNRTGSEPEVLAMRNRQGNSPLAPFSGDDATAADRALRQTVI